LNVMGGGSISVGSPLAKISHDAAHLFIAPY
jgi:hypothetical protein